MRAPQKRQIVVLNSKNKSRSILSPPLGAPGSVSSNRPTIGSRTPPLLDAIAPVAFYHAVVSGNRARLREQLDVPPIPSESGADILA